MSRLLSINIFNTLSRFDAHPKIDDEFSIKTFEGATVTIISWIIISRLIWCEFIEYITPTLKEELFVDTSRSPNLKINLDVIIPRISCDFLALDAMDSSGEQHLRIEHNIYKRRLDLDGRPIEEPKKEDIIATTKAKDLQIVNSTEPVCGSCYGAEFNITSCCNTCEEVREAYRLKQWAFPEPPESISQCKSEKFSKKLDAAFKEGCQIYGSLEVNRVGGSFHIAPGQSFSVSHVHVHDVQPFSSTSFNTSHRIRHLSFGQSIQNTNTNPLDGENATAVEGATMFQYYIKIVPTAYSRKDNYMFFSNQFSVTKHKKVVHALSGESGMPGIFFSYELSPFMVKYTETTKSIGHTLTNVCAIIGGVYTVASIISSFLYYSKYIVKKDGLGKIS